MAMATSMIIASFVKNK